MMKNAAFSSILFNFTPNTPVVNDLAAVNNLAADLATKTFGKTFDRSDSLPYKRLTAIVNAAKNRRYSDPGTFVSLSAKTLSKPAIIVIGECRTNTSYFVEYDVHQFKQYCLFKLKDDNRNHIALFGSSRVDGATFVPTPHEGHMEKQNSIANPIVSERRPFYKVALNQLVGEEITGSDVTPLEPCVIHVFDFQRKSTTEYNIDFVCHNRLYFNGGYDDKVLYKGYWYRVRREGKRAFIVSGKEGEVALKDVKKWVPHFGQARQRRLLART